MLVKSCVHVGPLKEMSVNATTFLSGPYSLRWHLKIYSEMNIIIVDCIYYTLSPLKLDTSKKDLKEWRASRTDILEAKKVW